MLASKTTERRKRKKLKLFFFLFFFFCSHSCALPFEPHKFKQERELGINLHIPSRATAVFFRSCRFFFAVHTHPYEGRGRMPPRKKKRRTAAAQGSANDQSSSAAGDGGDEDLMRFVLFPGDKHDRPTPDAERELQLRLDAHDAALRRSSEPRVGAARDTPRGVWLGDSQHDEQAAAADKGLGHEGGVGLTAGPDGDVDATWFAAAAASPLGFAGTNERLSTLLTERRGKMFQRFGSADRSLLEGQAVADADALGLRAEEALFMADSGSLHVCLDGLPLSVEELYFRASQLGLSPEAFAVFSYFVRFGYLVTRFSGPSGETAEKPLEEDPEQQPEPRYRGWFARCSSPNPVQLASYVPDRVRMLPRPPSSRVRTLAEVAEEEECSNASIHFNLFRPGQSRKTTPAFRVAVCKISDPFPSLGTLASLVALSGDVPLRIAIASQSTLNFISVSD
jgi:tRNA-splicing endonuclease subunit sen54 N-term